MGVVFVASPFEAVAACLAFTLVFVGSLYLWRTPLHRHRDEPDVILRRFVSVSFVVISVPLLLAHVFATTADDGEPNAHGVLYWMGFREDNALRATLIPLAITIVLFVGPLVMDYADGESLSDRVSWDLVSLRNIVVGPLTEEIVFRGCMMPLLVPAFGPNTAILVNPLFFGLAHAHHILHILHAQGTPLPRAVLIVGVQLFYTSVFGLYSSFLLVRTGSIFGPIATHVFCNLMGFPRFGEISAHRNALWLWAVFVAGLVSFCVLLFPATDPSIYGSHFMHSST